MDHPGISGDDLEWGTFRDDRRDIPDALLRLINSGRVVAVVFTDHRFGSRPCIHYFAMTKGSIDIMADAAAPIFSYDPYNNSTSRTNE